MNSRYMTLTQNYTTEFKQHCDKLKEIDFTNEVLMGNYEGEESKWQDIIEQDLKDDITILTVIDSFTGRYDDMWLLALNSDHTLIMADCETDEIQIVRFSDLDLGSKVLLCDKLLHLDKEG